MSLVKAEGIVIRSMRMGETSKLVTLFTRELGILKVVAKGSRSSKSRMGAALELLTVSRIVYYQKENRELQFLSQADILEFFPNLQTNLEKWGFANACAELVSRSQIGVETTPKLYLVLLNTLRALNTINEDPRPYFWAFQMKLLGILGVAPNLHRCLNCKRLNSAEDANTYRTVHFDVVRGGFLCENCFTSGALHELSAETLRLLVCFQSLPAQKLSRYKFSVVAQREIENFFRGYFAYHSEELVRLSSLKFVKEIVAQTTPSIE